MGEDGERSERERTPSSLSPSELSRVKERECRVDPFYLTISVGQLPVFFSVSFLLVGHVPNSRSS